MELKEELKNQALGRCLTVQTHSVRITEGEIHVSWPQKCLCDLLSTYDLGPFLQS